jgi:hypothetical protein
VAAPAAAISWPVVDNGAHPGRLSFSLTAADDPMLAPAEIPAMMTAATATFTDTKGAGLRDAGAWLGLGCHRAQWGWYGQKGGLIFDAQSCLHLSTDDISMSVM